MKKNNQPGHRSSPEDQRGELPTNQEEGNNSQEKAPKEDKGLDHQKIAQILGSAYYHPVGQPPEFDLGLDISTSVVGWTVLDKKTGALIRMGHVKLNTTQFQNLWQKVDHTMQELQKLISQIPGVKRVFVEANAKGYSPGFSSADTLFTLAKMNGIVSYECYRMFGILVVDVNVTSARSRIGYKDNRKVKRPVKEKVREFVLATNPSLPLKQHLAKTGKSKGQMVLDAEMADEIDSWVICRGGQILNP